MENVLALIFGFLSLFSGIAMVISWKRHFIYSASLCLSFSLFLQLYFSHVSPLLFFIFLIFIATDWALYAVLGSVELFTMEAERLETKQKVLYTTVFTIIAAVAIWLVFFVNAVEIPFLAPVRQLTGMHSYDGFLRSLFGSAWIELLILGILLTVVILGALLMARRRKYE